MSTTGDQREVVLLKSLATNNRFYTLVPPESGIKNADAIASFPDDLPLGIAYPCLEDGLNDFAYRLRVHDGSEVREIIDPYQFGQLLTDFDLPMENGGEVVRGVAAVGDSSGWITPAVDMRAMLRRAIRHQAFA